jgi:hypothetical protein
MTLYRTGSAETTDGFWTPDPEYARNIRVGDRPMIKAELLDTARIKKLPGSPSSIIIDRERTIGGTDVLVFDAWDWDTQEYVVLNTAVLRSVEAFGG